MNSTEAQVQYFVGDRVQITALTHAGDYNSRLKKGDQGTIVSVNGGGRYGVCWDKNINGHTAGNPKDCPNGHGWNVFWDEIEPAEIEFTPENVDEFL